MTRIFRDIVERHSDEAAFFFHRRDAAARSPLFDLPSLAELDDRLDANLEGLIIAGEVGLEASFAGLDRARRVQRDVRGEVFTAAFVAAELRDAPALVRVIRSAEGQPSLEGAVMWAFARLSAACAEDLWAELSAPKAPSPLLRLAIGARSLRRSDPGPDLQRAIESGDPGLRALAFQAAGELGRRDLRKVLSMYAKGDDEAAPWAAWAAALLGDPDAARSLWRFAEAAGPAGGPFAALAARCTPSAEANARLLALARQEDGVGPALQGAMALGEPGCLSWALPLAAHPSFGRSAAWVYSTVTGAKIEPPLAVRKPTKNPDDRSLARDLDDPFAGLPSPDAPAIAAHWERVRDGFPVGERFLGGQRITAEHLATCLRTGRQPWRESAAFERLLAGTDGALFAVHGHGRSQARSLPARP